MLDETHDIDRTSWIKSAQNHTHFPIQNLPYGVFSHGSAAPHIGVAIGDEVLDLSAISHLLPEGVREALSQPWLNGLFALPRAQRLRLRKCISRLLHDPAHEFELRPYLYQSQSCHMFMPVIVGDYTDFYAGINHAMTVGSLFRPDEPLLPNYKHVPIGYHGRASSIVVSNTPILRPNGQRKAPHEGAPSFGPTRRLDYELELGLIIGGGNKLGESIEIEDAHNHMAGLCLLNDWSARDIQAWEYQPLGPFLAKSFASSISPWVITYEALTPFKVAQAPRQDTDPTPLAYLMSDEDQARGAYNIDLSMAILTPKMREAGLKAHVLSKASARDLYWTLAQMVTHHSSNGCNLRTGDLLGTGTISAVGEGGGGSMLELSLGGKNPIGLPGGETRTFVEDGDEIIMTATARADGFASIGFGQCRGLIMPAKV